MNQQNKMRELTRIQSAFFMLGGLLMVIGMGSFVFMFQQQVAGFAFLIGAAIFSVLQCMQTYHGSDVTIRRLKSIMTVADLLFVLAGVLMVDHTTHFLRPIFNNQIYYVQYIYNKWLLLLMIAVILEVYTVHRISYELKKQSEHNNN